MLPTPENSLLSSFSATQQALLQARGERVDLALRDVLSEPGERIKHVYFPQSGYVSMIAPLQGGKVEVGMVGSEGMVGLAVVLGATSCPLQFVVQLQGQALRIAADDITRLLADDPSLHRPFLRYAQTIAMQSAMTAFVNAEHTIEMRLARWLLMCNDRARADEFPITHEMLSHMLGVRRAGVTTAIHILEGHRAIRARRGLIAVLDRPFLIDMTDGAYGIPEAEYERLLPIEH